jgi:hypothetical protein
MTSPMTMTGSLQHANEPYRQWQLTLWRKCQMAFTLQRFACTFFSQLDVEYESLCDPKYKSELLDEVKALRAANVEGRAGF